MLSLQIKLRLLQILVTMIFQRLVRELAEERCPLRVSSIAIGKYFLTVWRSSYLRRKGLVRGWEDSFPLNLIYLYRLIKFFIGINFEMIYQVSRDGDTSSSCSECKKQNHDHSHNDQSSDEQELINPISKPLSQHHSHEHQLIKILQEQNKRLKLINEDQDKEIKDLRVQLQISKLRPFMSSEIGKSYKELPRHKVEGQITPKALNRVMSPEIKSRHQPSGETMLQVVLLEKQIKQMELKFFQMSSKLKQHEERQQWMQKFIVSFVNMAQQLSLNYGGKLQTRGFPLRKKTKLCWKYIKELINYLIK